MSYPKRPPFFAHRFCRLLAKAATAQQIGPDGCWLLTIIALLEDVKRYTGAVDFYNGQLMPIAGFTREHTFINCRKRCVEKGWLHYEKGGKRSPGRYWVLIPERFANLPDGPCDETIAVLTDENVSQTSRSTDEFVSPNKESLTVSLTNSSAIASVKAEGKRQSSYPSPNPKERPLSEDHLQLARHIDERTADIVRKRKQPNIRDWANTIRLMEERDGIPCAEIKQAFDWANQDTRAGSNGWAGWRTVIRSPRNLREKWETITSQMSARSGNDNSKPPKELKPA